uniref:Uncharacterized protein n=1 Tax=viral metagenome TaxID=1070528 RepID=A0A6C0H390_9ZZZZ
MCENLCEALLRYYNTSIFNRADMDDNLKKACYTEAKTYVDDHPARLDKTLERTVLKELIKSHEEYETNPSAPKKPNVRFIGGPCSLTLQWSAEYKKLIYIFGEDHEKKDDCPTPKDDTLSIEEYMLKLYVNGDVFIDFYIEAGAYFKNTSYLTDYGDDRLSKLTNTFQSCLHDSNSDQPKCKKGRAHYIDIRQIIGIEYGKINTYTIEFLKFSEIQNKQRYLYNLRLFFANPKVLQMIEDVSNMLSPKEFVQYLKLEFAQNYLFEKESRKSTISQTQIDNFINTSIEEYGGDVFISSIIADVKSMVEELVKYKINNDQKHVGKVHSSDKYNFEYFRTWQIKPGKDSSTTVRKNNEYRSFREKLSNVFVKLLQINALVVDVYLLARVLKIFNINTIKNKRDTDEPYEPHNIVIYAGDGHSDVYRKFLDSLGFKLIDITGNDWRDPTVKNPYNNCIDMEKFPQPFFEHNEKIDWLEGFSSQFSSGKRKDLGNTLSLKKRRVEP